MIGHFPRLVSAALLLALTVFLAACASTSHDSSTTVPPSISKISGGWEFRLESSSGGLSAAEVALQQGQVLVNGISQPSGDISASGTQVSFVTFLANTPVIDGFSGFCAPTGNSANSVNGTITGLGGDISNFTVTENGNVFNVTATLSGDGQSMLGTYASPASSGCKDSGTFVGATVPKLFGTYVGSLTLPTCSTTGCDSATATMSESSNNTATLTLTLQGTDNGLLTLTGPVTGNAFIVQGTLQGQAVVLDGFYEFTLNPKDSQYDLPTLYLADSSAPAQPVGLLTLPQN
jgi:hypothetical protein